LALLALTLPAVAASPGGESLPGPIAATVLRVVDGDTIEVVARIWLRQEVTVLVRLDGIDAPELSGACPAERQAAERARQQVQAWLASRRVALVDVRVDKYGGRVLGRVVDGAGADLAQELLAAGLVRATGKGGRRAPWCAPE
jgi:endonuclease YncB( thermonuclease family)